jgi:iron complex outermembrane receptor protein
VKKLGLRIARVLKFDFAEKRASARSHFRGVSLKKSRRAQVRAAASFLFLFALLSGTAAGQEPQQGQADLSGMNLEDLTKVRVDSVYGASKFLQKASDSPTNVTVVTADDIRKYGYRTLADVLETVRGFYVINDRNYTYVGVRGFSRPEDYNARILFLVDGHRINDNIFDGAYVGTEFPVDLDLVERIEIIRGPSSSIYGTGAFAAVINVITRRGRDLGGAETSAAGGNWNTYKGRATYGARMDSGIETLVSGSFYNSLGHDRLYFPEFNSPSTNNGIARDADADQSYNIFGDLLYRDFDIHVVQASRTKRIPTASFGTVFNDPRTQTTDGRGYIDVQYHHTFGSWETLGRLSYDWYNYHGIYVYDYAGTGVPPFTENYDAANGTWWDFQGDASHTFWARHKVTLGTEFRQDLHQSQINYDIQPYQRYLDDHRSAWLEAFYVQDEYALRGNVTFVAGVRSDWHKRFATRLSPRAGVLFSPGRNTDIRLNYSWAFRAPNSYENFYAVTNSTANPLLVPEKMRSWEADIDYRFTTKYSVSAAAFLNQIDDMIEPSIDPVTDNPIYLNSGPIRTKGFEAKIGAKWPGGFEGGISDTLQDSRFTRTGTILTNSPKNLAKVNFGAPIVRGKFFVGADAQYVSRRRTIAETTLGGYFLTNLVLSTHRLTGNFDISGGIYNLFNKHYAESGSIDTTETSIPQDGRSFRIQLIYRPHVGGR